MYSILDGYASKLFEGVLAEEEKQEPVSSGQDTIAGYKYLALQCAIDHLLLSPCVSVMLGISLDTEEK